MSRTNRKDDRGAHRDGKVPYSVPSEFKKDRKRVRRSKTKQALRDGRFEDVVEEPNSDLYDYW